MVRRPFIEDNPEDPVPADEAFQSEAEEENGLIEDDQSIHQSESEGEDLFAEGIMEADYTERPELDRYDPEMLDDNNQHRELSTAQARAVGELLDAQQQRENDGNTAFRLTPLLETEEADLWKRFRERREHLRSHGAATNALPIQEIESAKEELPFCTATTIWGERVSELLTVVFHGFFTHYRRARRANTDTNARANTDSTSQDNESTYMQEIHGMVHADKTTLIVLWDDLRAFLPKLVDWIYHLPSATLDLMSNVATEITRKRYASLYSHRTVSARIAQYDVIESMRTLTTQFLNKFIAIHGVVIRRSYVEPKYSSVYYQCMKCHCDSLGPYILKSDSKRPRLICFECQATGPFQVCREKTLYENHQTLIIQEPSATVVPGSIPKQKQVVVLRDLVDVARPGDEIVVLGVFETRPDVRLNASSGFPVFSTHILANNIEKRQDVQQASLTETDLEIFEKLSRNPLIREKIIDSIAPSIWGHRHIKTGLAYAMLGGVNRTTQGGHSIRGDINVLLLGDPGVGKSQFLKYVERAFERTIYTTGKGSTAVGLTAAVRKDDLTGDWCLEGGALVLADEGICLIDEFDKMSEQDRVSIHEAMEQQSISISKAGIVATLKARCSVIAAANPIGGRYDASRTFADNVDLTSPILSRFDIVAVVRDRAHPIVDELLADHIVSSHAKATAPAAVPRLGDTNNDPNDVDNAPIDPTAAWVTDGSRIPQEILRKYIAYARRNCKPQLTSEADQAMLSAFYVEIRQAAQMAGGGVPVTVRHLESVLRMAAANARTRLSNIISRQDLHFAISTMVESYIQTQKYAMAVQLGKKFGRYRAIASSPHEFIETMLMHQLARNTQKALRAKRINPADVDFSNPVVQTVAAQVEVPFEQLTCLMKSMYNIPETAVIRYRESDRFKKCFTIVSRPSADGSKDELFIRKARR